VISGELGICAEIGACRSDYRNTSVQVGLASQNVKIEGATPFFRPEPGYFTP
jgi:hypothetical protein